MAAEIAPLVEGEGPIGPTPLNKEDLTSYPESSPKDHPESDFKDSSEDKPKSNPKDPPRKRKWTSKGSRGELQKRLRTWGVAFSGQTKKEMYATLEALDQAMRLAYQVTAGLPGSVWLSTSEYLDPYDLLALEEVHRDFRKILGDPTRSPWITWAKRWRKRVTFANAKPIVLERLLCTCSRCWNPIEYCYWDRTAPSCRACWSPVTWGMAQNYISQHLLQRLPHMRRTHYFGSSRYISSIHLHIARTHIDRTFSLSYHGTSYQQERQVWERAHEKQLVDQLVAHAIETWESPPKSNQVSRWVHRLQTLSDQAVVYARRRIREVKREENQVTCPRCQRASYFRCSLGFCMAHCKRC